jgi:hypothetical protein
MDGLIDITQFDTSAIAFSTIKKNKNGGKFVSITGKRFIRLPAMRAPFGASAPGEQVKEYYLNLSVEDPVVSEKLTALDAKVLEFVHQNSVALLGKEIDIAVMRDLLYSPVLKQSKDGKYAPTIKAKASSREGAETSPVYNSKKELVSLTDVTAGCQVASVIELSQIWFINGKFGLSMRLNQAKLTASNKLTKYAFDDDDEPVVEEDEIDGPTD